MKLALACSMLATLFCIDARSQTTTLASVDSNGVPANSFSFAPALSAGGRFVAFVSKATNLVPGDTNDAEDVFVHDLATGETTRVSVASDGTQAVTAPGHEADYGLFAVSISGDGRYVAFESAAVNLVPGDTNGAMDVFVHDRLTGVTERVSVDSFGAQTGGGNSPVISNDGQRVLFLSAADDLVPGDTNRCVDAFVHDRTTRRTTRVSVSSNGEQARWNTYSASMSGDGRYVVFETYASNLVPDDTNELPDVFMHDLATGQTERVSLNQQCAQATIGHDTVYGASTPVISADGRFVAFKSDALGMDHFGTQWDAIPGYFSHDRLTCHNTRVSVNSSGSPVVGIWMSAWIHLSISGDGRYVAFSCFYPITPIDTNWTEDVYVHDTRTGETALADVSLSGGAAKGGALYPSLSGDGSFIAFESASIDLVPQDTHGLPSIFVRGRLAHDLVEEYCFGDGSTATTCPCFNFGRPRHGCANSEVASGALLATTGRPSNDTLTLIASGETSTALTIFVQGSTSANGGVLFGDGFRCASGTLTRLYMRTAVGGSASAPDVGEPMIREQSALLGDPIPPGDMRFYQAYYREPDPTFCTGSGFNATNAILVGW